jgi:hypothetical protein
VIQTSSDWTPESAVGIGIGLPPSPGFFYMKQNNS